MSTSSPILTPPRFRRWTPSPPQGSILPMTPPRTPCPFSPLHSPPPPPILTFSQAFNVSVSEPTKATLSEMNLNRIDYLLVGPFLDEIPIPPSKTLRELILNPSLNPGPWKNLKMLASLGDLYPALLPQISDCDFLLQALRALLIRGIENLNQSKSDNLVPEMWAKIVDSPPFIPKVREILTLIWILVEIEAMGFSDALKIVKTKKVKSQIQLEVRWKQGGAPEEENSIRCCLEPRTLTLFDPHLGREIEVEKENLGRKGFEAFRPPPTDADMTFLYWNAKVEHNIKMLISQHLPRMIIISETRVSRENTAEVIQSLPFDEWIMVEPTRFSGGIVILWDSRYLSFEPIKTDKQGIHGIVQGSYYQPGWFED